MKMTGVGPLAVAVATGEPDCTDHAGAVPDAVAVAAGAVTTFWMSRVGVGPLALAAAAPVDVAVVPKFSAGVGPLPVAVAAGALIVLVLSV